MYGDEVGGLVSVWKATLRDLEIDRLYKKGVWLRTDEWFAELVGRGKGREKVEEGREM